MDGTPKLWTLRKEDWVSEAFDKCCGEDPLYERILEALEFTIAHNPFVFDEVKGKTYFGKPIYLAKTDVSFHHRKRVPSFRIFFTVDESEMVVELIGFYVE